MIDFTRELGALERTLNYHLDRQAIIGANLANAETPGYHALDLGFDEDAARFAEEAAQMRATLPGHLAPRVEIPAGEVHEDPGAVIGPDGNSVQLEREMARLQANSTRYAAATEITSRRIALLRYAAMNGNG